ncbi:hypothetical protein GF386_06575 [Candidatus Pacearchaeota archaeon]|nr:hypothetical protein [Candidatus Pacearchaeota archaeon]MBD3283759.1 hypothetical protein [Candidatus Pacearchaeota archaeon]
MARRYAHFSERGQGRALIELSTQYNPKQAVREYVTNCIDARIPGQKETVSVIMHTKEHRLIVSDNGTGISYEKLLRLPEEIGESEKAGKVDFRGEKALGLLAFGSLGLRMHLISRHYKEGPQHSYQRWEMQPSKGRIPVEDQVLTPGEMDDFFYGSFAHGTRVVIDGVDSHIMNKILSNASLRAWLRQLYDPVLQKGVVDIKIGRYDPRRREIRTESLQPLNYEREHSSRLRDEIIKVTIKNEEEPGNLEVLLFVDPQASTDKVAVYSKDVLVNESIADRDHFPEFSKSPVWTSGKVSGFVNDYFNRLVLGREGIERKSNAFRAWYHTVQSIEEQILPVVEETKKRGKRIVQNRDIRRVFDAMSDIWKDLRKSGLGDQYTRTGNGDKTPVSGTEPSVEGGGSGESGKQKPGTGKPPGPGTFEEEPEGIIQRVTRKRGIPFACPQPIPFPLTESHLRSRLEDKLGASPTLYINSEHEDYSTRASAKERSHFVRYIADILAKELSQYEANRAQSQGRLKGEPAEMIQATLRREEEVRFLLLNRLGVL